MNKREPPLVTPFPRGKQRRLDQLLDKNSQGLLTAKERATLTRLVAEAESLMVENARRLADFVKEEKATPPAGAIPVTVWIQPHPAER